MVVALHSRRLKVSQGMPPEQEVEVPTVPEVEGTGLARLCQGSMRGNRVCLVGVAYQKG